MTHRTKVNIAHGLIIVGLLIVVPLATPVFDRISQHNVAKEPGGSMSLVTGWLLRGLWK